MAGQSGGGTISAQATARAAPDGYTLAQGYVAAHGTSPATHKLPCDAIRDYFTPIGNQTQAMFPGLAAAVPHMRSGRVRPLAVTGPARHPQFKDVPALDESGFKGFYAQQWYGVVGPAGMPASVVRTLSETLAAVLTMPELRETLSIDAVAPNPMSPEQYGEFVRAAIERRPRRAPCRRCSPLRRPASWAATNVVDMTSAALVNGISSRTFDFDDTHLKTIIHPAGPASASAALALAGHTAASGRAPIDALVLGIDMSCCVGNAMYPFHYDRGGHFDAVSRGDAWALGEAISVGLVLRLESAEALTQRA